jgi:hypothetical protein
MTDQTTVVWKHIGLHGHSMGTLSLLKERITWKGALTGGGAADDEYQGTMVRNIPASAIKGAQWTVFGRSGHLRIQIQDEKLPHELRFDGFPAQDVDILKDALQQQYKIAMQLHTMSSAGTQYGLTTVQGKQLLFRHCVLDEMNEEGQEFEPRPEHEMMSLNLAEVSQCVLPGNNRNEIEVQFPESDAVEAGTDQLGASIQCIFCLSRCYLLYSPLHYIHIQSPFAFTFPRISMPIHPIKRLRPRPNCYKPKSWPQRKCAKRPAMSFVRLMPRKERS